nr:erythromycin esterase family protein [Lachnospiraceae bacterium]
AYIQGNDDTAEAVTKRLGYRIYRTDQMCELVEWMHDYNETAEEEDKVRLYGMDMQYDEDSIEAIKRFYEKVDESKKEAYSAKMLEYLGTSDYEFDASKYDEIIALMDEIQKDIDENKEAYAAITGEAETETIKWIATNIQYFISYHVKENATHMARDTYMKMNVDRILEVEEREHNGAVMIACHNSHMTKNLSTQFTFLGKFLRDEYADSYFAIGTDYYYSNDNVPNGNTSERITVKLCSDDPIAYQVKDMPEKKYYIDFSHVDNSTPLGNIINKRIKTGSVGEQYNVLFKVMKMLSQVNYAPTDMYDAMIVFYEVNPITIWED